MRTLIATLLSLSGGRVTCAPYEPSAGATIGDFLLWLIDQLGGRNDAVMFVGDTHRLLGSSPFLLGAPVTTLFGDEADTDALPPFQLVLYCVLFSSSTFFQLWALKWFYAHGVDPSPWAGKEFTCPLNMGDINSTSGETMLPPEESNWLRDLIFVRYGSSASAPVHAFNHVMYMRCMSANAFCDPMTRHKLTPEEIRDLCTESAKPTGPCFLALGV